jgi:predicted metalloprotease
MLILLVLSFLFRENFFALMDPSMMSGGGSSSAPADVPFQTTPEEEELVDFISFVLDDVQGAWNSLLPGYQNARLVLFRDAIDSACGFAQSATGPFYCPGDQKVYIDLGFYNELRSRFGAPGDFAQAYVLAHELGHHVQTVLGIEAKVRQAQRANPGLQNELSVRMELQADCFAGVWGHTAAKRGILETGDIEEGLNAAAAIGDDRMQRMSTGYVNPDSFTHGSSEQRMTWLRRGLETGDPEACDTFSQ